LLHLHPYKPFELHLQDLNMKRPFYRYLLILVLVLTLAGCAVPVKNTQEAVTNTSVSKTTSAAPAESSQVSGGSTSNPETNSAVKSNDTVPDYAVVFPQDSVNRIDITLSTEAWTDLQAEMTQQFGTQGTGKQGRNNQQQPQPGNQPGGGMGGMNFGDTSYVSSAVTFNGDTWENVGFRYSGNSTLQNSWRNGTQKISFRLDFDAFEEVYPATKNQRFYGFNQIAFKSNAMDDSYIREKVVADIFRESGVVASQTAFYEVYIDYGEGSQYLGVYTAVELPDDTVIQTQFADDGGNMYKPEGTGAAFVDGTFSETTFEKHTNKDEADWSDIQAVFTALNSNLRTTDPTTWRSGLEAVFDVDAFLRWLAVDTIIQNWDTYGSMAHNYYLYTDPTDGRMTWIPWDNNEALKGKTVGQGGGNHGGPGGGTRELDLSAVSDQWPLIRYLIDDPVYLAKYQQYLQETIQGAWQPEKLAAIYQKNHDLIEPYVQKEEQGSTQLSSIDAFNQSVEALIQHANDRYDAVVAYLGKQ
jgi:spore coat protein H